MRINEDTRQGLKYSLTRGFVPPSLVLVSRQLLPMLKINFECLIRPDEISIPFGLSLSKPFGWLRANGSNFTGPDQSRVFWLPKPAFCAFAFISAPQKDLPQAAQPRDVAIRHIQHKNRARVAEPNRGPMVATI